MMDVFIANMQTLITTVGRDGNVNTDETCGILNAVSATHGLGEVQKACK
jgi:hypothetical protein